MNNDTTDIIMIAVGIIGVIFLGALFISLSRWERAKNYQLKAKGNDSPNIGRQEELRKGNTIEAVKGYKSRK